MSLETVLEIFRRDVSIRMGIWELGADFWELRVLWGDSLQKWRFSLVLGVNIPPFDL